MQVLHEDKDRKVIPRWRDFRRQLITREFEPIGALEQPIVLPREFLDEKLIAWKENKNLTYATDLVSSAIVLGRKDEVKNAAKYILKKPVKNNETSHRIAKYALGIKNELNTELSPKALDIQTKRQMIHSLKDKLKKENKNVFLWNDLALLYESLGFYEQ